MSIRHREDTTTLNLVLRWHGAEGKITKEWKNYKVLMKNKEVCKIPDNGDHRSGGECDREGTQVALKSVGKL